MFTALAKPSPSKSDAATRFGAVEVLPLNFVVRLVLDDRREVGPAQAGQNRLHHLQYRHRRFRAEVERFTHEPVLGDSFGQRQVRGDRITHVEVVAHKGAVAPNHRRCLVQGGANSAGDEPVEIEIAATVQVAAPRDRHR